MKERKTLQHGRQWSGGVAVAELPWWKPKTRQATIK
jgi:hypothetical protein